jgi:hypothetical protein
MNIFGLKGGDQYFSMFLYERFTPQFGHVAITHITISNYEHQSKHITNAYRKESRGGRSTRII